MLKMLASLFVFFALSGCSANLAHRDQPYPTEAELIGVYFWGDGYGANQILVLREDGTYKQTLLGHIDPENVEFQGRWRVDAMNLYFCKADGVCPAISDFMTRAETFFHEGKPAFVREQDLKGDRVNESWVYTWQRRPDA